MKKYTYGSFKIEDHAEMARYFLQDVECGKKYNLNNVVPSRIDISEVDLLKLKIELLREGFELELIEDSEGDSFIADKVYSYYLLSVTPKLEEFFKMISSDDYESNANSSNRADKYRSLISNIADKVRKAYGDFNIKSELHKEKLENYKKSIEENKNVLESILKKGEQEVKEYDKKLKIIDKNGQNNAVNE